MIMPATNPNFMARPASMVQSALAGVQMRLGQERIKEARIRSALAADKLELSAEAKRRRELLSDYRKAYDKLPDAIREARSNGDVEVADQLQAVAAKEFDAQQQAYKQLFQAVPLGKNDAEKRDAYHRARADAIQSGVFDAEDLPAEYSPQWLNHVMRGPRAAMDKIQKERDAVQAGKMAIEKERTRRNVRVAKIREAGANRRHEDMTKRILSRAALTRGGSSGSKGVRGKYKASDANSVMKFSVGLFSDDYDINGNLIIKDQSQRLLASLIAERAEALHLESPEEGLIKPVLQAYREMLGRMPPEMRQSMLKDEDAVKRLEYLKMMAPGGGAKPSKTRLDRGASEPVPDVFDASGIRPKQDVFDASGIRPKKNVDEGSSTRYSAESRRRLAWIYRNVMDSAGIRPKRSDDPHHWRATGTRWGGRVTPEVPIPSPPQMRSAVQDAVGRIGATAEDMAAALRDKYGPAIGNALLEILEGTVEGVESSAGS